jgi:hypothetical protein
MIAISRRLLGLVPWTTSPVSFTIAAVSNAVIPTMRRPEKKKGRKREEH